MLPHVPDAWMDRSKDKVGYEINFTKEFYEYKPLRNLEEIRKDGHRIPLSSQSLSPLIAKGKGGKG